MRRFLISTVLLAGCSSVPVVPVAIEPSDTDKCPAACEHLRALGCEEGQPLVDGTTCEQFCIATQKAGHALNPTCVVTITACAEVETKCAQPRSLDQ